MALPLTPCTTLRAHREARGLTQEQVARLLHQGRRSVVRWETDGQVPVRALERLAAAWGVTVEALCQPPEPEALGVEEQVRGLVDEHGAGAVIVAVGRVLLRSSS